MDALGPTKIIYNDSEEAAQDLKHTRVTAMQISKGAFSLELTRGCIGGWSLQYLKFAAGSSTCAGEVPSANPVFLLPFTTGNGPGFKLLGSTVDETMFGAYGPGSEHSDVTVSGVEEVIVAPPASFFEQLSDSAPRKALRCGSRIMTTSVESKLALQRLLRHVQERLSSHPPSYEQTEVSRSVSDALEARLTTMLEAASEPVAIGRPSLPRPEIMRRIRELLHESPDRIVYANELCTQTGISIATLRRVFIEWFDLPPARYLLLKRYHIARSRLRSGNWSTVSAVAESCGFWDLSRFSAGYKAVFGELPSKHLKRAN